MDSHKEWNKERGDKNKQRKEEIGDKGELWKAGLQKEKQIVIEWEKRNKEKWRQER